MLSDMLLMLGVYKFVESDAVSWRTFQTYSHEVMDYS